MSRSRRTASQSVSLFPFLAVLVCAMGALILLLIVNTRRIRLQSIAQARQTVLCEVAETPSDTPPILPEERPLEPPVIEKTVEEPSAVVVDAAAETMPAAEEGTVVEVTPEPLPETPAEEENAIDDGLLAQWQAEIERLQSEKQQREEQLRRQQSYVTTAERDLADVQQRLTQISLQVNEKQRQVSELTAAETLIVEKRQQMQHQLRSMVEEVAKQRQANAQVADGHAVVPYRGAAGTNRRPIFIECTADGIRFLPEAVTIRPDDLRGFTQEYNPVLAGTRALVHYWTAWERVEAGGTDERSPYVLLLVRPGGELAYHVARDTLSSLDHQMGYELLEANWRLELPAADPKAADVCRFAVEELLKQRADLLAQMGQQQQVESRWNQYAAGNNTFAFDASKLENPLEEEFVGNSGGWSRPTGRSPGRRAGGFPADQPENNGVPQYARNGEGGAGGYASEVSSGRYPNGSTGEYPGNFSGGRSGNFSGGRSENFAGENPGSSMGEHSGNGTAPTSLAKFGGSQQASTTSGQPQNSRSHSSRASDQRADVQFRKIWGQSDADASIGYEREAVIDVYARQVIVGAALVVPIDEELSKAELKKRVVAALDRLADSWGKPPRGFYWVPSVQIRVTREGRLNGEMISSDLERMRLTAPVEETLTEPTEPAGETESP